MLAANDSLRATLPASHSDRCLAPFSYSTGRESNAAKCCPTHFGVSAFKSLCPMPADETSLGYPTFQNLTQSLNQPDFFSIAYCVSQEKYAAALRTISFMQTPARASSPNAFSHSSDADITFEPPSAGHSTIDFPFKTPSKNESVAFLRKQSLRLTAD